MSDREEIGLRLLVLSGCSLLHHVANYLGTRGRLGQVLPFTPAPAASIAYQILGSGRRLHMLFCAVLLRGAIVET